MRRGIIALLATFVAIGSSFGARATEPGTSINFQLVGHEPLYGRGMNAAPAMYGHHLYIGNRTDGSPHHPHPGILIVDVADPAAPTVVGEMVPPDAGNVSETTRELRVWPQQKLLIVMNFQCSELIHACTGAGTARAHIAPTIRFFDLSDPEKPALVSTYQPPFTPHEMFLWTDPKRTGRALLYYSTPTSNTTRANLIITDISKARAGAFSDLAQWKGNDQFPEADRTTYDVRLHSIGVSANGTRTYLAYLGGGFLVLDTSDFAKAKAKPAVRLATPVDKRVSWGNPGAHSAVKIPGRDLALVTDEVYGDALDPITGDNHGCPWGWVRIIDIADEARPKVISEYRTEENEASFCGSERGGDPQRTLFTSFSAHNPTVLRDLALVTWHSGGLQAISLADPKRPKQAGVFTPAPLDSVSTEDPALSMGPDKVVMWSYPIIQDGLIYLVDLRNGLYVVRYTGPGAQHVSTTGFLEGNSNLGDAGRLETAVLGTHLRRPEPAPAPRADRLPSTGESDLTLAGLCLSALALAISWRLRAKPEPNRTKERRIG